MADVVERLRGTTRSMAYLCDVDMELWNDHFNACLEAAAEIKRLRTLNATMMLTVYELEDLVRTLMERRRVE